MSHEVRTPLNGMVSMVDILDKTDLTLQQKSYIDIIKNCNIQLLDIVNDILDYSKIITNGMKLKLAPMYLNKTVNMVCSILGQKAIEKNLKMEVIIDNDVPEMLIADATRLKQVLINIISNSIKFTKKGGITIEIKVGKLCSNREDTHINSELFVDTKPHDNAETTECMLYFTVKDTGIGIQTNKISKVFDSFRQIDNDYLSDICGVGLGLPITKHIIELYDGEIYIDSIPNVGTTVTFNMKFILFNNVIDKVKLEQFYTGRNVLLIDTDVTERIMLFNLLSELNIKPIMTGSISEALLYLSNVSFDFEFILININSISADDMAKLNHIKNQTVRIIVVDMESTETKIINYDYKLIRPINSVKLTYLLNIIYVGNKYHCKSNQNEIILNGKNTKINELNVKNNYGLNISKQNAKLKILVAEDNKQNQQVLLNILNYIGDFDIIITEDGRDSLDQLHQNYFDIAFIDLKMPILDGITVSTMFKEKNNKNTVLIAVTASMSDETKNKCFGAGMNGFVSKPIDINSIETIIKLVINKKTYM